MPNCPVLPTYDPYLLWRFLCSLRISARHVIRLRSWHQSMAHIWPPPSHSTAHLPARNPILVLQLQERLPDITPLEGCLGDRGLVLDTENSNNLEKSCIAPIDSQALRAVQELAQVQPIVRLGSRAGAVGSQKTLAAGKEPFHCVCGDLSDPRIRNHNSPGVWHSQLRSRKFFFWGLRLRSLAVCVSKSLRFGSLRWRLSHRPSATC